MFIQFYLYEGRPIALDWSLPKNVYESMQTQSRSRNVFVFHWILYIRYTLRIFFLEESTLADSKSPKIDSEVNENESDVDNDDENDDDSTENERKYEPSNLS